MMYMPDLDMDALELYTPRKWHGGPCLAPLSLYDQLAGKCPCCGAALGSWPGKIAEETGELLMMLQARRAELLRALLRPMIGDNDDFLD